MDCGGCCNLTDDCGSQLSISNVFMVMRRLPIEVVGTEEWGVLAMASSGVAY